MFYDFKDIEEKWKKKWDEDQIYKIDDGSDLPPFYVLDMFPYPSGSSMHVGHPRGYIATDIYSRYKRMSGYNVLHPMGWDSFGLPAEETAMKEKVHPAIVAKRNIDKFRKQLKLIGPDYDWSREISTSDPDFYKHTQRIFLEFFKRGLAYNSMAMVNWCEALGTVLANEDIIDGKSERGEYPVVQRPMRQWILAITEYADRLLDDLKLLTQWPDGIVTAQVNWIGRSEGHQLEFEVTSSSSKIEVFTTKLETLYGVTFIVVALGHPFIEQCKGEIENYEEVQDYIEESRLKTDLEKKKTTEKTGVLLKGLMAIHPGNGKKVSIWVGDYVSEAYGTGAIMGVPAHDKRDLEFAEKFGLDIIPVLAEDETLLNSDEFTGLSTKEGAKKMAEKFGGKKQKKFKIRDWVFSRQRFWGEPFPIVWVKGKEVYKKVSNNVEIKKWLPEKAVSYTDENQDEWFAIPVIPKYLDNVMLPTVESYSSTATGEGPLANISSWVNTYINVDTGEVSNDLTINDEDVFYARRETNTMPQWAGSSWYYLRYIDNKNDVAPFSVDKEKKWSPIRVYAGADHATAHLIYARFWHKVLFDAGMVSYPEPFPRLEFLGYILDTNGGKFSKRNKNSITPDEVIEQTGADSFRLYEMFIGPFEKPVKWNKKGPISMKRFLDRIWRLKSKIVNTESSVEVNKLLHKTIKEVSEDIENFKFNTAVAKYMTFINLAEKDNISKEDFEKFLKIFSPFSPFITEEIWSRLGNTQSIHLSSWPEFAESKVQSEFVTIVAQLNGKKKGLFSFPKDVAQEEVINSILEDDSFKGKITDVEKYRIIFVKNKLINFVG